MKEQIPLPTESEVKETEFDYESIESEKVKSFELQEMVGNPIEQVAEYVVKKYGAMYHIPDVGYWRYLKQNPSKIPQELKDGNSHHFFGPMLRPRYGGAPDLVYPDADLHNLQTPDWHDRTWSTNDRVALIEK